MPDKKPVPLMLNAMGDAFAKQLKELPPGARLGDNSNAFAGGYRLWKDPLAGKHSRTHSPK